METAKSIDYLTVYLPGEIKPDCRGEMAVVVSHRKDEDPAIAGYDPFLYPILSEEIIALTGTRTVDSKNIRVYLGLSQQAGNELVRKVSMDGQNLDLKSLDQLVVTPHFMRRVLDMTQMIMNP